MRGRLKDLTFGEHDEQHITVTVTDDFRQEFNQLKDQEVSIEIKKWRKPRSKSANAYFHVLVNKIASKLGEAESSVKIRLVLEYGALAKDEDGLNVGFKLPTTVDVSTIYPYVKKFDVRQENGKLFNCYLVYKRTRFMDTAEMSRLVDGAIDTARELGIETDTPEQLARYKETLTK